MKRKKKFICLFVCTVSRSTEDKARHEKGRVWLGRVGVLMGCVASSTRESGCGGIVSEDFHGQKINGGKVVSCGCHHWCNGLAAWRCTTVTKIKGQMGGKISSIGTPYWRRAGEYFGSKEGKKRVLYGSPRSSQAQGCPVHQKAHLLYCSYFLQEVTKHPRCPKRAPSIPLVSF
jgi:hypothetical protein